MHTLLGDMGYQALLIFMSLAAFAGLAAGAALILNPGWLAQLGKYANRWVSTRKFDRSLERWVSLDKWFYQHHRASGGVLLVGAAWVILFFVTSFDRHSLLVELVGAARLPSEFVASLLDAFVLIALAGAVFAGLVSLFLIIRPSMLRDVEQGTNRWLSLRKTLKPAEIPRAGVDEYVFHHVRLAGILLLLGGVYILGGLLLSLR